MSAALSPEKARIFRITHVNNVPWILEHGMCCRSSSMMDSNFVEIGSVDLITKRKSREIPIEPGGTLSDYVPFYFTPWSIMMYNIVMGYGGVERRDKEEIVIFVSSLPRLQSLGVPYLFTNGHAYNAYADYFSSLDDLDKIDWDLLNARDFRHDPEDPGKKDRYQAEALAHREAPVEAFIGIGCFNGNVKARIDKWLDERGKKLDVKVTPKWYF